jgi:hypothetical protein
MMNTELRINRCRLLLFITIRLIRRGRRAHRRKGNIVIVANPHLIVIHIHKHLVVVVVSVSVVEKGRRTPRLYIVAHRRVVGVLRDFVRVR